MITLSKLIDNGLLKHANQIKHVGYDRLASYWNIDENYLQVEFADRFGGHFSKFELDLEIELDQEKVKVCDSNGLFHFLIFMSVSSVDPQKYLLTEQEQLANL